MTEHKLNLPWRIEGCTLIDSEGVPVAVTLGYTSIRRVDSDGTVYNTSEYAGPLRAEAVCATMNGQHEIADWQVFNENEDGRGSRWVSEDPDMIEHWQKRGRRVRALAVIPAVTP